MRVLWLPDVLRAAGLTVRTYPGWQTRGSASWGPLRGVICHATAGSRSSTEAGEARVLWETGSTSAPVPIAQCLLGRSGTWWVGASGRCNHVALSLVRSSSPLAGSGNSQLIGVEAANDNRGEPWSSAQLRSYERGVAAICRHMGWPAWRVLGHAEHQSGRANNEPSGIDMTKFRAVVARLIEESDVSAEAVWKTDGIIEAPAGSSTRKTNTHWTAGYMLHRVAQSSLYDTPAAVKAARAEIRAVLAAVSGRDAAAEIAALGDQLGAMQTQLDQAAAERAELLTLVRSVAAGEADAAAVVDEIARRLGAEAS